MFRKAFKYRLYPNEEQAHLLNVFYGQKRFVYNHFLNASNEYYKTEKKHLSYQACCQMLTTLKKDEKTSWLTQSPAQILQQSLKDLGQAFSRFFKKLGGFPSFKKRTSQQSIRFPQGFLFQEESIRLPKLGVIKCHFHRELEGLAKNVTISKTKSGAYFVSIQVELECEPDPMIRGEIGLDLGLSHLVIDSNGTKTENPRWFRKSEERIKRLHKRLSQTKKGSKNRDKIRRKLAKAYEKQRRQREDFWHKLSFNTVKGNHLICIEDLKVCNMLRNHKLSKSIQDAGWGLFVRFLAYKAERFGSVVQKISQWFPSSKLCSSCGEKAEQMGLSVRSWVWVVERNMIETSMLQLTF